MEYRQQLEYIKTRQYNDERRKGKRRKKRISRLDKFFWKVLFIMSVLFVAAMLRVGFFPIPYIIAAAGILLSILMIIIILHQRACRSRKRRPKGRFLTFFMIVLLGAGGFYLIQIDNAIDKVATGEENGAYSEAHKEDLTQKAFNIYVSGIDVYGEITTESRSDVNLIVTVNPKTHEILITTTPRDYYVTIPGISGEAKDKLTHAGIYGIDTSIATLENLYNTEIPFYTRVNFTSVIDIVDAMEGIDVNSDVAFTTGKEAGTVVEITEGKNHLNGKEALAFVRERKAFADGDNQRGKNQQALMTALIKKAVSPVILIQAKDIIAGITGNAETNMSEKQIKALIKMQLNDLKGWTIETVAASGNDSGKQYCYSYSGGPLYVCVPDQAVVSQIQEKIHTLLIEEEN